MAEASSEMTVYKSVYVGNIPDYLDHDDDFRDIFMQFTDFVHSARIIRDFHSKWSRGFGFLIVSEDDAEKLIRQSNSGNPIVIGGQELRIKRAAEERPFKQKKFIPTPGYNGYKRPSLPEFVSYEENEPGKPTIHSLNDDVLKAIFKYFNFKQLIGIERVCRRWQFLIYEKYRGMSCCFIRDVVDPIGVSLTYFQKDLVPTFPTEDPRCDFKTILKYQSQNWTRVSLKQVVEKILLIVGENLPSLSFSKFKGSYSDSRALAQLAPNLETLCLKGTSFLVNLSPITESCKNLTHLILNNIPINKNVMAAIAKCEKLETLSACVTSAKLLKDLPKTVKNLHVQIVEKHLDFIILKIQHLKDLERLSFHKEMLLPAMVEFQGPNMVSFNSRQIKWLAENHKNLKYLNCFTRAEVESVDYSALTNLEHLHLEGYCPLTLFDNLPPKLQLLGIFPWGRKLDSPYSLDLSSKLPSSFHSLLVHKQYFDLESLLTLKDVPSVTKLVVLSDESYRSDGSSLHLLHSLVKIPNLRELYIKHLDQINQQKLNEIAVSRKNSLSKVKKNDNLNQEKHPLLLYVNSLNEWKEDSEHIQLVSISKPMLDGVVFPHTPIADDDSSVSGLADLLRDQLLLDNIVDGQGLGDDAFRFELDQMLAPEPFDDFGDFFDRLDDSDAEFGHFHPELNYSEELDFIRSTRKEGLV